MRKFNAKLIAPFMALTGFSFGKSNRHNSTIIYKFVNTVHANHMAWRIASKFS